RYARKRPSVTEALSQNPQTVAEELAYVRPLIGKQGLRFFFNHRQHPKLLARMQPSIAAQPALMRPWPAA
ncbi:hypothetical protein, partial [Xanthomonas hortorum]|uniref:hypothetical protein n=1 Tax=Xanthomonas hortorum TaxID=56454 RepID=UPI001E4F54F4